MSDLLRQRSSVAIGPCCSAPKLDRTRRARAVALVGLRSCRETAILCRECASCRALISALRAQVVSYALPGDPVATWTPDCDREPEFSVTIENRFVASRPLAWSCAGSNRACCPPHCLTHRASVACVGGGRVRGCVHRPLLAIATRNFLSQPTASKIYR